MQYSTRIVRWLRASERRCFRLKAEATQSASRSHAAASRRMIEVDGSSLTLEQLVAIADRDELVAVAAGALQSVDACARRRRSPRRERRARLRHQHRIWRTRGDTRPPPRLGQLQINLLRSHAAGVGEPLPVRAVRATMALRVNVLAKGFSGIRSRTLTQLVEMLNRRVHPRVPSRGSVGASGDLAPLAHLALVLIGEGEASVGESADVMPGREALRLAGLEPIQLAAKEGLALINGTQPSAALAALALDGAERLARAADIAVALSIDALRGSVHPFDARIQAARPYRRSGAIGGQRARPARGSGINKSHEHCGRVQDAYSLRCAPQVHGAARHALRFVHDTLVTEANSATDNPIVFAEQQEIVSGGNFHGAPVAIAADLLIIAHRATRDDQRTALRSPRQPGPQRAASVPDSRQWPAIRLHDGAGDRRGVGVRDQNTRTSGQRGHHPDVSEPRGPCEHEHGSGVEGRTRALARHTRAGGRDPVCVPGARSARATRNVSCVAIGARLCALGRAAARHRSSAVARHRAHSRDDRRRKFGILVRARCQVRNFSISV